MDIFNCFFDFTIHINKHLIEWTKQYGYWIYIISFLIVFCETGLVVIPFLPGDSLLFALGALAFEETNCLNVHVMLLLISIASILGDTCNYLVGKFFGKKLFRNPNSLFFRQSFLKKTHDFYEKYGGKTIVLARFVPIVRTFAPFVAGMGQMNYTHFFIYNTIGGVFWAMLFLYIGYFFSQLHFIKNYFSFLSIAFVFISLLLGLIETLRQYKQNNE
ncbi:DedA family protein [Candidatus Azobacteroides pseudotrichonymphae]|uniref:VTT domain-containing protein n=1 Tax=Azobacteroides pseudotrichonymphae genomovar. CFP2 TaxID=511995 RepID=B6YQJ3_AZOPC|nr:DedA family protein [Candidatus Azobacteroides pseudotrichonymphae]BAG83465.1 conserved hypothetical protein [Candidatus Azobacteroides pseudotrichonymphae genomovar. CFP2]